MHDLRFYDIMKKASDSLSAVRLFGGWEGCGSENSSLDAFASGILGVEPKFNTFFFEFIPQISEALQNATDIPPSAVPFVRAMATLAQQLVPPAPSKDHDDFCGTAMPLTIEQSFHELFGNIDAIEVALDELAEASRDEPYLQRFSEIIWEEIDPYIEFAQTWMKRAQQIDEERADMLEDLNDLCNGDDPTSEEENDYDL